MNKKAGASGEFTLWFFRFVMATIAIVGIIAVASILYSKQIDVRQIESDEINEKLFTCNLFSESNFNQDSLKKCIGIDKTEEYLKLSVIFSDKSEKSVYSGDKLMEETCKLVEKFENKPFCQEQMYYVLFDNKRATLNVLVGIKKVNKNYL